MKRAHARRACIPLTISVALAATAAIASSAPEPYEINVILPLTGGAAFLGKKEQQSLEVIEHQVDASGGVRGRPIAFVYFDDQSSPQISVQLTNQISAKHVPVILGSSFVQTCSADMPLIPNGPVMYCFSPGIYPPAGSYMFTASMSTTDLLGATATYYRDKGWRKVAIITSTDASGQDGERQINTAFGTPDNSVESIVDREHFNTTDISVSAQMTHVKESGAQALIAWVTGPAFGTILRGMTDAGLDIPVTTSTGNLVYQQLESYDAFMPDTVLFPGCPGDAPEVVPHGTMLDAVDHYIGEMKAAGYQPDQGNTLSWDPTLLVIDAFKKYGFDMTATQLRDYLDNVQGWSGINGVYNFHDVPQRGLGPKWVIMVQWDKHKNDWAAVSGPAGVPLK